VHILPSRVPCASHAHVIKGTHVLQRLPPTVPSTTLAISGIPPFAGFFSKDAILVTAFASGHYIIWAVGSLTAGLTAFYMFRLLFTVFHARAATAERKIHPLTKCMTYRSGYVINPELSTFSKA